MKILVVEDDPLMQATLKAVFRDSQVSLAASVAEAQDLLSKECFTAAFLDVNLKGAATGVELLKEIRERDNFLPCVMLSGVRDRQVISTCIDSGAVDYVVKADGNPEVYRLSLQKALAWRKIATGSGDTRTIKTAGSRDPYEMLGSSPRLEEVKDAIDKAGRLEGPFLVLGETGTGKELVARRIWAAMNDPHRPFIALNCASLPENLVESELFGFEKGAFTGALTSKAGLFEAANGGDIFLDEIGEIGADVQAKLLRVLQEKRVRRVGSDKERPVDFRVIAATNAELVEAVHDGAFRDDLFYRLNVHQIRVPSLRERREDIPALLEAFFAGWGKSSVVLEDGAVELIRAHHWPGNIRQLRAFAQAMVPYLTEIEAKKLLLTAQPVSAWLERCSVKTQSSSGEFGIESELQAAWASKKSVNVIAKVDAIQRGYVETALRLADDNRSQAAKLLGVSRQRLSNWLNDWGLG